MHDVPAASSSPSTSLGYELARDTVQNSDLSLMGDEIYSRAKPDGVVRGNAWTRWAVREGMSLDERSRSTMLKMMIAVLQSYWLNQRSPRTETPSVVQPSVLRRRGDLAGRMVGDQLQVGTGRPMITGKEVQVLFNLQAA